MSVSISNCFSNLLCQEDSSGVFSGESPGCSNSDLESPACVEESISVFIKNERHFVPDYDCFSRFQSPSLDAAARLDSIAWILKNPSAITGTESDPSRSNRSLRTGSRRRIRLIYYDYLSPSPSHTVQAYYGFQPLTAYLSVNYLDRFLCSRRLPQTNGWPLQLLSVACLSLAAKMEEPLVPALLDLQIEGAKYIFEPRTICRMELLVLRVLDWRLRSVTPFNFIAFFAYKLDPSGDFIEFLISRATEIILSHIRGFEKMKNQSYDWSTEVIFLEYWPSCIAAAALLCAANEVQSLSVVNPEHAESWCNGLRKENIMGCYRLMQEIVLDNTRRKSPKILPQYRVTVRTRMRSSDLSSSYSSSSSSSSSSPNKRRKLNQTHHWVHDDKGNNTEE
uniref:B-like cyclin n=1 Tax=Cucumis melo TaxID=3656 RepID=A0A9I9D2H7_CUCME